MSKKSRSKKSRQLAKLHRLVLTTIAVVGVSIGSAAVLAFPQPTPSKVTLASTSKPSKSSTSTPVKVTSKSTPPTPTVPKPVATTVAPTTAKPVTKAPVKAVPVPIVVPSPRSSVSDLTPTSSVTSPSGSTTTPSSPSGSSTPSAQSVPSGSSTPASSPTTTYTSRNWSGYMATTGSYSAVSADWTVPEPTGNGTTSSADSTWVGIGGVTSADLIQVGTEDTVSAGGQVTSAGFFEMLPAVSQPTPSITVSPGDSMAASVVETSPGEWTLTLTDLTNSETFTDSVAYQSTNSSAEWVEEDPSYSNYTFVPFDDFGNVELSSASTTDNGTVENIATSNAQSISMVNREDQLEASPSAIGIDGASFKVTWQ